MKWTIEQTHTYICVCLHLLNICREQDWTVESVLEWTAFNSEMEWTID